MTTSKKLCAAVAAEKATLRAVQQAGSAVAALLLRGYEVRLDRTLWEARRGYRVRVLCYRRQLAWKWHEHRYETAALSALEEILRDILMKGGTP